MLRGFLLLLACLIAGVVFAAYRVAVPAESRPVAEASAAVPIASAQPAPIEALTVSDPALLKPVAAEEAVALNRKIAFVDGPNPAASPLVVPLGDGRNWLRSLECLTTAIYYEAGNETVDGQRAVAQVILNRVRDPAYPNSVCEVVYEGSERRTGCQFTFTCDGSLARRPLADGWRRAQGVASLALGGYVFSPAGWATHYHADYVVPNWAYTLAKVTQLGTHIFYRWPGRRGSPVAFTQKYAGLEPEMSQILASIATLPAQAQQPAAHIPVAERPIIANSPNQATAGAPIAPVSPERWILEGPSRTSSPAATPDKAPLSAEPKPTKVARASP